MAFYYSSTYQCVSNQTDPENASKRRVLTWVHSEGFDLSDLTVKTAILTYLCHLDTFCRGNTARPCLIDQPLVRRKDFN